MSETMRAAVMTAVKQPLEIRRMPVPAPGAGEVLVKLDVCGLCHSDLHFWLGEHPMPRELPVVLGHEGIGHVVSLGSGVTRLQTGDRVGIGYVYGTCGDCRQCLTGRETHCSSIQSTGVHAEGCFAEYTILRADWATRIPQSLDESAAAPLLCAGVAAYSAIRKARIEPGDLVAVFGAGGLGTYAIQIAKAHGARVAVVDVGDEKLAHGRQLGADYTFRADQDAVAELQRLGGTNASFNFAPVATSWRQMVEASAPLGRLVLISLPAEPLSFEAPEIIENGLEVLGSADGTRQELRQLMQLASDDRIRSVVESVPLTEINGAMERLAAGSVQGRLVIDMRP